MALAGLVKRRMDVGSRDLPFRDSDHDGVWLELVLTARDWG